MRKAHRGPIEYRLSRTVVNIQRNSRKRHACNRKKQLPRPGTCAELASQAPPCTPLFAKRGETNPVGVECFVVARSRVTPNPVGVECL